MRRPIVTDAEVDDLIAGYDPDPEASHVHEDVMLDRYVRAKAKRGDKDALRLVRLLDTDRARWYA